MNGTQSAIRAGVFTKVGGNCWISKYKKI